MEKAFRKSWIVFKYLFLLFTLVYWVGIVIDDWHFVEHYWEDHWLTYLGIWGAYFLIFSTVFSLWFWGMVSLFIFINHKIIQPFRRRKVARKQG